MVYLVCNGVGLLTSFSVIETFKDRYLLYLIQSVFEYVNRPDTVTTIELYALKSLGLMATKVASLDFLSNLVCSHPHMHKCTPRD